MPTLIIWDVHTSIVYFLQCVGSGMSHYLHITRVGFEDVEMSQLGHLRPL